MRTLYSVPAILLAIAIAVAAAIVGDPDRALDYARIVALGCCVFAAAMTFWIFWHTRRGIDKVPPMALALLFAGGVIEEYRLVDSGERSFRIGVTPFLFVASIMIIVFVFVRYGRGGLSRP